MPRPTNEPFHITTYRVIDHPTMDGFKQASAYINDKHGQRKRVSASGKTGPKAKRALDAKVKKLEQMHTGGNEYVRHDTKLPVAAERWMQWRQEDATKPLAANTERVYRNCIERTISAGDWAKLTVSQVNDLATIDGWLAKVANQRGTSTAIQTKKILGQILGWAQRYGAIERSVVDQVRVTGAKKGSPGDRQCSPDCEIDGCRKRHLRTDRAFTKDEMRAVLEAAEASTADIGDLAHFLFGTGVRISEALRCVEWADVDLDKGIVHVRGTKTARSDRWLGLSPDLVEILRKRGERFGRTGLVFGSTRYKNTQLGAPRKVENVCNAFRKALDQAGCRFAGTHTFRRSVATWMDDKGYSLARIANHLGHAKTSTTALYLGRQDIATDAATVMVLPPREQEPPPERHLKLA